MRTFLFDKDGTLIDSEGGWFAVFESFLQSHGHAHTPELHAQMLGTSTVACAKTLQSAFAALPQDPASTQSIAEKLLSDFLRLRLDQGVKPMPGASLLLERCHAAGHCMALVTSADRANAEDDLHIMGWSSYFTAIITGNDVTRRKPAPDPYLLAAARLGVKPQDCLAIEDGENGVTSAKSAGMRVLLVRDHRFHSSNRTRAHHAVATLVGLTPHDLSRI